MHDVSKKRFESTCGKKTWKTNTGIKEIRLGNPCQLSSTFLCDQTNLEKQHFFLDTCSLFWEKYEICQSIEKGSYLVAKQSFQVGDTILEELPLAVCNEEEGTDPVEIVLRLKPKIQQKIIDLYHPVSGERVEQEYEQYRKLLEEQGVTEPSEQVW